MPGLPGLNGTVGPTGRPGKMVNYIDIELLIKLLYRVSKENLVNLVHQESKDLM